MGKAGELANARSHRIFLLQNFLISLQGNTPSVCLDTASGSYGAGAELVHNGDSLVAKYAGQTILVPSDQLANAQQLHAHAIQEVCMMIIADTIST